MARDTQLLQYLFDGGATLRARQAKRAQAADAQADDGGADFALRQAEAEQPIPVPDLVTDIVAPRQWH